MEKIEQIVRMAVPDNDMRGWLNVLREGGLSEEEIDQMMVRLNETYRNIQGSVVIDREVEKIKEMLAREHKYYINNEQEDQIRTVLGERLGVKPKEDDRKRISQ